MTWPGAMVALRVAVSALVAAAASYACNRLTRGGGRRRAVVFLAPGLEESFKTGAALVFGAPVLVTHVTFGAVEAVYDLVAGLTTRRSSTRAPAMAVGRSAGAAAAGLAGHALFGALTVLVAEATGAWPFGVAGAYVVHVGWNALVTGRVRTG